jgi:hypothetical protein
MLAVTPDLAAQARQATRLAPPDITLDEEFTAIASVRELADGRLLVTDEREGRVVVLNLRTGGAVQIGRKGKGPSEYTQVGRLWPLAADSSILKEPFLPRWLILSAARVVTTVGPGDPSARVVGFNHLRGADGQGNVYWTDVTRGAAGRPIPGDSLLLLRINRRTQRVDTITKVESDEGWSKKARPSAVGTEAPAAGGGASKRRIYQMSLAAPDQIAVYTDGWIAIARANPYRVDWCAPNR